MLLCAQRACDSPWRRAYATSSDTSKLHYVLSSDSMAKYGTTIHQNKKKVKTENENMKIELSSKSKLYSNVTSTRKKCFDVLSSGRTKRFFLFVRIAYCVRIMVCNLCVSVNFACGNGYGKMWYIFVCTVPPVVKHHNTESNLEMGEMSVLALSSTHSNYGRKIFSK